MGNNKSQYFNNLHPDIQETVAFELRSQHYDAYSGTEIFLALRKINPVIWYENDKYNIWDASRNAFEKEIEFTPTK